MTTRRTYTGYGGQMAVLVELLIRQCNVAVPIIDLGTDVFAFRDDREEVACIQVKTAQGTPYQREEGYSAEFDIPMKQLGRPDEPPLYYALAVCLGGRWGDFLIVSRRELSGYWNGPRRFGTENQSSGNLVITVQYRPGNVRCGEVDLTAHQNAWDVLPPFRPLPEVKLPAAEQAVGTDRGEAGQPEPPSSPSAPPKPPAAEGPPQR